jgi:hypothetical protein
MDTGDSASMTGGVDLCLKVGRASAVASYSIAELGDAKVGHSPWIEIHTRLQLTSSWDERSGLGQVWSGRRSGGGRANQWQIRGVGALSISIAI